MTFTATVSAVAGAVEDPTGIVQFVVDGANFGAPVALSNGIATSPPVSSLSTTVHTVTASYVNTDGNFTNSSGSLNGGQVVKASSTTTLATSCMTTFVENQSIALTATINGSNPTGGVSFQDGTNVLCNNVGLSSGSASCQTPALMVQGGGTSYQYHPTASYSGDNTNGSSTSSSLVITVLSAADVIHRNGFETESLSCPIE